MDRIRTAAAGETIALAMDLVPEVLRERLGPIAHWEGDPHFAGLLPHLSWEWWQENYRPWTWEQPTRTVRAACTRPGVWRGPRVPLIAYLSRSWLRPAVVLHELGHAVHDLTWRAGGERPRGMPRMGVPLTREGGADYGEYFAEAFTSWLLPPDLRHAWRDDRYEGAAERFYASENRVWLALFNELADLPVDLAPLALGDRR